jgi:diaminohydroxyphosphoribosylaminopyrimidine deaminase/5-amino-6-(5-phosphoribosylamino)uracil reductase
VTDVDAMVLALAEAVKGLGRTHPNPAVGAVVVKGGRVIGRGFHARAGEPHAEVIALGAAGAAARGATLYVTLEPCNHHGRTPPCTDAILAAGVKRVVYASTDPNPLVNGRGARRLASAGVQVTAHVLREEAEALNRPFFKVMRTGLPWVTLKAGVTLDGKLATSTGRSKWITSPEAREAAHHLRDLCDAILIGAGTVRADNPRLTTRLPGGRNATRVVLDAGLRTPPRAAIYDTREAPTIVATSAPPDSAAAKALTRRGVELWSVPSRAGKVALRPLLKRLVKSGRLHLLVEGGAALHGAFLAADLVDELVLFVAPSVFGHAGLTWSGGLDILNPARAPRFEGLRAERVGVDLLVTARRAASTAR